MNSLFVGKPSFKFPHVKNAFWIQTVQNMEIEFFKDFSGKHTMTVENINQFLGIRASLISINHNTFMRRIRKYYQSKSM